MSDVNGTAKSPSGSKAPSLLKKAWRLFKGATEKDIEELERAFDRSEIEGQLQSNIKELATKETEIVSLRSSKATEITKLQSEKEKEIEKLRKENEALLNAFTKSYDTWKCTRNKEDELQTEIASLQSQLKNATERANSAEEGLTNAKSQLAERRSVLAVTENNLRLAKGELRLMESQLDNANANLNDSETLRYKLASELGLKELNPEELLVYDSFV
jgi:chromosome segregation ATPase